MDHGAGTAAVAVEGISLARNRMRVRRWGRADFQPFLGFVAFGFWCFSRNKKSMHDHLLVDETRVSLISRKITISTLLFPRALCHIDR